MEAVQVAETVRDYRRSVPPMTLLTRLEQVKAARGWSWDAWSTTAGLSQGYLRTLCTRLRKGADHAADHDSLRRLALAADVPLTWLEDGLGTMGEASTERAADVPAHRDDPPADLADAVVLAFDAARHDPADVRALLDLLRTSRAMHRPSDPVAAMRGLLDGIRSARADGAPLTWLELALRAVPGGRVAAEARSEELNSNGDRELATLKRRES